MKNCPVCKSDVWNYDVIDSSTGIIFCGDCYFEVKQYGYKHNLMKISKVGYGRVFKNKKAFNKAIKAVKGVA